VDSRLVVGFSVDARADQIRAALVRVAGVGLDSTVESLASIAASGLPGPDEPRAGGGPSLAVHLFEITRALAAKTNVPADQVLLQTVTFDGESDTAETEATWLAARVAELSGTTVLAGLAARDRAAGGRGRPLGTIVDWLVANEQRSTRLVVHVDGIAHLTWLPAGGGPTRAGSMEVGPGMWLLGELSKCLAAGRHTVDERGILAVQGRQIKPLTRRWATHPFLRREPPRFLGPEDFGKSFIEATAQYAAERGWSVADILCTATHLVAACPADVVRQFLSKSHAIDQVIFVGRGTQNGFLLRLLQEQFVGLGLQSVPIPGISPETFEAATAAVLGALTMDNISCNLPALTAASGPRLLGQFTPGSPENWARCVEWMNAVHRLKLRAA
jgi:1,6-anhydro-N-acetylmuramate kinase